MVQIWLGSGLRRFRLGSDLARLGAKAVQIGFRVGSDWVQIGFRLGSDWVQIWLGSGLRRFRLGSDLVAFGSEGNSEPLLILIWSCVA